MDLPNKYKLFWIFLLTDCDHAGVWQVNYKTASFYVGEHLEPSECERFLKGRIVKIENDKYWFLPKFIEFQYGQELKESNLALKSVIQILRKYKLFDFLPKVKIILGANKGHKRSSKAPKDKDKEEDKGEDKRSSLGKSENLFLRNPSMIETIEYFESCGYPKEEAEKFWSNYEGLGWVTAHGGVIKNWQAKVIGWMNNSKQLNNGNAKDKTYKGSRRKGDPDPGKYIRETGTQGS